MATDDFSDDIAYEKFAQEIYQTLLDSEEIKPIKVQHNVDIAGRSGCKHQIDVYWEYEIAEVTHRIAIECKNYNTSNISIGRIRDFFAALTDIGNINGIFVCKKGYQSGAIKFAEFYRINLKELRVPVESDWEGRVQTIQINLSALHTNNKKREIAFDNDWVKENYPIPTGTEQNFSIRGNTNEIIIKDSSRNKITDLHELDNKLPHNWKDETDKEHIYQWDDAYIEVEGFGDIKILFIKYVYDVIISTPDEIKISAKDTAKAILKDVKTGTIKFFDTRGNIK